MWLFGSGTASDGRTVESVCFSGSSQQRLSSFSPETWNSTTCCWTPMVTWRSLTLDSVKKVNMEAEVQVLPSWWKSYFTFCCGFGEKLGFLALNIWIFQHKLLIHVRLRIECSQICWGEGWPWCCKTFFKSWEIVVHIFYHICCKNITTNRTFSTNFKGQSLLKL